MKTRLAILLAVVTLVASGALAASRTGTKPAAVDPPVVHALAPNAAAANAPAVPFNNWNFANNHGRIRKLYPTVDGVYFAFGGQPGQWQTAMNPTYGYYFIPLTHPNYKSLVDLLYLAAEHDWNLQARTQPALGTGGRADVIYLVQDFAR